MFVLLKLSRKLVKYKGFFLFFLSIRIFLSASENSEVIAEWEWWNCLLGWWGKLYLGWWGKLYFNEQKSLWPALGLKSFSVRVRGLHTSTFSIRWLGLLLAYGPKAGAYHQTAQFFSATWCNTVPYYPEQTHLMCDTQAAAWSLQLRRLCWSSLLTIQLQ